MRERVGDILPLAQHFIDTYASRLGYGQIQISTPARQQLLQYLWPGNIRELENVIHHALLICNNQVIEAADLQLSSLSREPKHSPHVVEQGRQGEDLLQYVLEQLFEQQQGNVHAYLEDQLFRAAYRYSQNNQVHTASLLGLSRNIVRARLIELGELVVSKRKVG